MVRAWFLLDGFDLDEVPLKKMDDSLADRKRLARRGAFGLSATCSKDEPLLEAARLASRNLCLLDLKLSKIRDTKRLLQLIPNLKRCGVTLSIRIGRKILPMISCKSSTRPIWI